SGEGIAGKVVSPLVVSLTEGPNGKLRMKYDVSTETHEQVQRTESIPTGTMTHAGDEVAPYCYATEDSIDTEERTYWAWEDVPHRYTKEIDCGPDQLSYIVEALKADKSSKLAATVLKYLEDNHGGEVNAAKKAASGRFQSKAAELAAEAARLQSQSAA